MLWKLQRKTMVTKQLIGYALTLFTGMCILLITLQLYFDLKPVLNYKSDIFKDNYAIVSKNVSIFKTRNKEKIYFTESDLNKLKKQKFVKEISKFHNAKFKVTASLALGESSPIYSDLFFESVPQKYIENNSFDWSWDFKNNFIPIVVPETYLNLYNFGFAESQGLPVFSKNTISEVVFNILIKGDKSSNSYKARIVGFSSKINSILVPEEFLLWANKKYSGITENKISRLLVEFDQEHNEMMLDYFNNNNYDIKEEILEVSKLMFFLKSGIIVILIIGIIIVSLSIAFILLSINLVLQRNKDVILNLHSIGYSFKEIARFYQLSICFTTIISFSLALACTLLLRCHYMIKLSNMFDIGQSSSHLILSSIIIVFILIITYYKLIGYRIKNV